MFRIGFGQDSHQFSTEAKPLVLGGVTFAGERGLLAHSDGDVVLHALFNALSGSVGGESIGYYFSDKDPANKGRDSREFIALALNLVKEKGFELSNVDINIEAKQPKITPQAAKMKETIAEMLDVEPGQVAIKATTGEGLTAFGRGEGIQVFVAVLVEAK